MEQKRDDKSGIIQLKLECPKETLVIVSEQELSDDELFKRLKEAIPDIPKESKGVIVIPIEPPPNSPGVIEQWRGCIEYRYVGHVILPERFRCWHLYECYRTFNCRHLFHFASLALDA